MLSWLLIVACLALSFKIFRLLRELKEHRTWILRLQADRDNLRAMFRALPDKEKNDNWKTKSVFFDGKKTKKRKTYFK